MNDRRRVRIGVILMPTDPWPETVASARRIEALGFEHLWIYDHLSWQRYRDRPWHATYPWLTGVAAHTERIRVGTMVSNPNLRHPVLLARDSMTIDHVSGGRLVLGIGAGGTGFDASVLGQSPLTPGQRVDRLEEFVPLLAGLLCGELTDHHGAYYDVVDARMLVGCVQSPRLPIAIAAGGARSLRLAARWADAWITYGATTVGDRSIAASDTAVREQVERLDHECARLGRDPGEIDRIYMLGNADGRPLANIDAFDDVVGRSAELGFTDVVFPHPRPDDPEWDDDPAIVDEIARRHLAHR